MQQQMFPCPRCGYQNVVGQQFCTNCGAAISGGGQQQAHNPQQMYSCPICHQPVVHGVGFCGNCKTPLNWPTQQQMQPSPAYKQEQQGTPYQNTRFEKSVKKTSPWLIVFLALIGIIILIGGGIFAFGKFSQGTSSSTPPTSTSPTQTPTIKNTNAAELILTQDDMKSNGWILDHETKPQVPGSTSTHSITFIKTGKYLHMNVSTFATDSDAERNYSDSKFNNKNRIIDIVEIGDEGYAMEDAAPAPAPAPAPPPAPPEPPPSSSYEDELLSPASGSMGIPVKSASFYWSSFGDATKWKFVLARDAAMTQVVKEAETSTTAYLYDGTLDYSTNYFWRVMAIEPPSDWSVTFSFQTEEAPAAPPAPEEPEKATNYGIFFLKNNVVVEIIAIADYDEILSYAKIVEARIQ